MTTLELRQKEAQLEETECTSKEEVLAGIDAGLKDVLAGRTQSFDDFIKEIETQTEETECTSKEKVLAGIDAGLKDVLAGKTRPATELLEELLRKNGLK